MSLLFQEINLALSEMYLQEEPIIFELPKKRVVSSTEMEQCWHIDVLMALKLSSTGLQ